MKARVAQEEEAHGDMIFRVSWPAGLCACCVRSPDWMDRRPSVTSHLCSPRAAITDAEHPTPPDDHKMSAAPPIEAAPCVARDRRDWPRPRAARRAMTHPFLRLTALSCVSVCRIRATMMIASLSTASALVVGMPKMGAARVAAPMMATIDSMLATMDGPDLYWGDKGPLQNPMKEESDFKEFDKYSIFVDACKQHGVDLSQPDITVMAPGNKACEEYSAVYGPLTQAVCAYHVVKGVVSSDGLSGASLTTVEGSTITYRRMFRKHFVDNAFTAAISAPPRSSFKGDIKADNGVIHMLNEVIYPGWSESAGMEDATR